MELYELNKNITKKSLPKLLIFVGEEYELIKLYIKQMSISLNLSICEIDSPITVLQPQKTISLIGDRLLYVCRYSKDILTSEKCWKNIKFLGTNYLVLVYTSIDKRSKFYTNFKDSIVEFQSQDLNTLKIMLKGKHKLSEDNIDRLITNCQNNYGRCLIELDKIYRYSKIRNISEDNSYLELLKQGTIYETNIVNLENFVNLVLKRDKLCYNVYISIKNAGESNLKIISWLYNTFRNQFIVETVKYANTDSTGLNYFFIKQALDRKNIYTKSELRKALETLKNIEQGIKSGEIDEAISVDYLLSEIL